MFKGDLLDWRTQYSLGGPTVTVSHWRDEEPDNCSILKAKCLINPSLTLKTWRISGELLVFNLHEKSEEAGSNVSEETQA